MRSLPRSISATHRNSRRGWCAAPLMTSPSSIHSAARHCRFCSTRRGATMAKLRHLAIATEDPDRTAQFYVDVFEFKRVREARGIWGHGHILSDGTINLAILKFVTDAAAGVEKGVGFRGLHHIGFEVTVADGTAVRVAAAGARERTDTDDALGIAYAGPIKGEVKYDGHDAVVFDLIQL